MTNFLVHKPLSGHDEDAPPFADNKMIVVCDGLGGGGQNRYSLGGETHTSAYLGSRKISQAFRQYCDMNYDKICYSMENPKKIITDLKKYISESLTDFVIENGLKNSIRGKSMQMLPSTLAAIVYKVCNEHIDALVISAGDSRAYMLTPDNGLQQLSEDDVFDDVDAYSKSATMTNNIRQDGEYHINYAYYKLPLNCILFVSSDGCFDYVSTPMEWEYILETAIVNCKNILNSEHDALGESIGAILEKRGLKDDCTIAGTIFGFSESDELRRKFFDRGKIIQSCYTTPYSEIEKEALLVRTDTSVKTEKVEKQVIQLTNVVMNDISEALKNLVRYEIFGIRSFPKYISQLRVFLNTNEKYLKIFSIIEEENEKRHKETEKLNHDYNEKYKKCRKVFEELAKRNYLNSLSKPSIFGKNTYRKQLSEIASKTEKSRDDYKKSVKSVSEYMSKFIRWEELNKLPSNEEISEVYLKFSEFVVNLNSYRQIKSDSDIMISSIVNKYLTSSEFDEDFKKGWKNGFYDFRFDTQYSEIKKLYSECIDIQKKLESCNPINENTKLDIAYDYLNSNSKTFVELILGDCDIISAISEDSYRQLISYRTELDNYKNKAKEYDYRKKQLWQSYKPVYELFRCSNIKGSV